MTFTKTRMQNGYYVESCEYCGRVWWMDGGYSVGFIVAGANSHIAWCKVRTPAERRKQNVKDERRWKRSPPTCQIVNDPNHPGLRD